MSDFEAPRVEKKEPRTLMERDRYTGLVLEYALSLGWVKGEQREAVVKLTNGLYDECLKIIEDAKAENVQGETEEEKEGDINKTIERLNNCLDMSKRVGSTETNNILMGLEDYRKIQKTYRTEYAVASFKDFLAGHID